MKPVKLMTTTAPVRDPEVAKTVEVLLAEVNGRAWAHAITSGNEIFNIIETAEQRLAASGLPKAERAGVRLTFQPAGPRPGCSRLNWRARTTRVTLERNSCAWYLTGIAAIDIPVRQPALFRLEISPAQAASIQARSLGPYEVRAAA